MIHTILFDLSEVLIAGLLGVEKELSPLLNAPEAAILPALGSAPMEELFRGRISEEVYLSWILQVINRKPGECLFVDDNPLNVQEAGGAGIIGVEFPETKQLTSSLRSQEVIL